jgi:tetratricopeptide (TPR) repeat protein
MSDTNEVLQQAIGFHRAGRRNEAEGLYRQILSVDPGHADGLHLLGVIAHEEGKHEIAVDLISRAIARNDRCADYHCNIGLALQSLGRLPEAEAHFLRAIDLDPNHAESHSNWGDALKERGRLAEAEAHLRRALAVRPLFAGAHFNLGNVLLGLGRHDEAVKHYQQAIALRPSMAVAHYNLGYTLKEQGKLVEALEAYRRAQAIDPGRVDVHNNLGTVLFELDRMAEAEACFRQALAQRPDSPMTLANLANALTAQGKHEEAAAACRRAIELEPPHADAHYNFGKANAWNQMAAALAAQGDLHAAHEAYQKAVELVPTKASFHRGLALSKRFEAGDRQLAVMEQLAANPAPVPEPERIHLQFALGKAYADLKDYDRSFRHLLAGNRLKREQLTYDDAGAFANMQRVRNVFSAQLLQAKAGGKTAPTPVFIVGMPRSGTTLIEQIIASHPKAFGAGELLDLHNIVQSLAGLNGSGLCFPEVIETMSREQLRQVGARYLAVIRALAPTAERIVDKMPGNFHFPGLIQLALPNARIIHSRRDPVDTCLSCFSILFEGDAIPYSYDLGELGRFYRSYDALMAHWRAVLRPGLMIEVQYEEVVADLENQARRIIAHCGLEWDDACLAFYKTRRPVRTSSVAQVRQPIYNSSVGRWRPYREQLRALLEELRIDPENESAPVAAASAVVARPTQPTGQLGALSIKIERQQNPSWRSTV